MTEKELFAKYEPNPSALLQAHDAYNARTGLGISMPGLRTRAERAETYRQWAEQDAKASLTKGN